LHITPGKLSLSKAVFDVGTEFNLPTFSLILKKKKLVEQPPFIPDLEGRSLAHMKKFSC